MEKEHEEMLRTGFAAYIQIGQEALVAETDAQIDDLYEREQSMAQQWNDGPHAEHWQFLQDTYHDFQRAPGTMVRFMDNVDHNDGYGLTDVQRRSVVQVAEMTLPEPPQELREMMDRELAGESQPRQGRGIERSR